MSKLFLLVCLLKGAFWIPEIKFLQEKSEALKVFNSAKEKIEKTLEKIGNFEIKKVKNIEIQGGDETLEENSDEIYIFNTFRGY